MHDEATPVFTVSEARHVDVCCGIWYIVYGVYLTLTLPRAPQDMVDQTTLGHRAILSNFGAGANPRVTWQIGESNTLQRACTHTTRVPTHPQRRRHLQHP